MRVSLRVHANVTNEPASQPATKERMYDPNTHTSACRKRTPAPANEKGGFIARMCITTITTTTATASLCFVECARRRRRRLRLRDGRSDRVAGAAATQRAHACARGAGMWTGFSVLFWAHMGRAVRSSRVFVCVVRRCRWSAVAKVGGLCAVTHSTAATVAFTTMCTSSFWVSCTNEFLCHCTQNARACVHVCPCVCLDPRKVTNHKRRAAQLVLDVGVVMMKGHLCALIPAWLRTSRSTNTQQQQNVKYDLWVVYSAYVGWVGVCVLRKQRRHKWRPKPNDDYYYFPGGQISERTNERRNRQLHRARSYNSAR